MTSTYKNVSIKNVFQQLDDESSLWLLGLCLASNDLVMYHGLMDDDRAEERTFYYAAMLSVLREVAKLIHNLISSKADRLKLASLFSQNTRQLLEELEKTLEPYQNDSLTGGILKPVRDLTFHYDFTECADAERKRLAPFLGEIKGESELKVRVRTGDTTVLRQRYTFADVFRNRFVDSLLSEELVDQISLVTMDVLVFTDSLLNDLNG